MCDLCQRIVNVWFVWKNCECVVCVKELWMCGSPVVTLCGWLDIKIQQATGEDLADTNGAAAPLFWFRYRCTQQTKILTSYSPLTWPWPLYRMFPYHIEKHSTLTQSSPESRRSQTGTSQPSSERHGTLGLPTLLRWGRSRQRVWPRKQRTGSANWSVKTSFLGTFWSSAIA